MKKTLFLIIFMVFSCNNNKVNQNIEIDLKFKNTHGDLFFKSINPLSIEKDRTNFIGIPENLDYWAIFKIDNHELYNHDKLNEILVESQQYTYVLSGKEATNSVMIIDKNNDKNFSNDEKIIFKNLTNLSRTEIANSPEIFKAPIHKMNEINLKLRIFPFPNYFTSSKPEFFTQNELQIAYTSIGYWYGEFAINDDFFKIALKRDLLKHKVQILFAKIKDSFDLISNKDYFTYNELDMVNLNGNNFYIEPINFSDRILKLKYKGNSKSIGLHKGFYIENYSLKLMDGDKKNISDLLQRKEYLVLDFWGTWCSPCIKLIPEVKKITTNYKNVQVLGIALDSREELVKNFINKNKISYPNHFISYEDANDENSVINKQRISNYPYYMLIDKNRKIIYRGVGEQALNEIKTIIKLNQNIN